MKLLSRGARQLSVALAVAGLLATPACKKDAPPGAEGAAGEAVKAAGEAGKAVAEGAAQAPAAAKALVASASSTGIEVPEFVVTVGGMPSIKEVLTAVSAMGNKVAPGQLPPDLASMAMEGIKQAFGFTDITWLKQDAPVRFAVVDPKAHAGKGQVIVLPITDKAKVLASLKADAKKDSDGHAATFTQGFDTWFVDFIDGHAVFTDHKDVFGKMKDFVSGKLVSWRPEKALTAQVAMTNVSRLYAQEMADAKRQLTQVASAFGQDPNMPDMTKVLEAEVDMLFGLVESTSRLDVSLWNDGDDAKLGFGLVAKDGTALQKFAGAIAGKQSPYVDAAPATTWLGMATNMDMRQIEAMRRLQKVSIESYAKLLKLTPDEQKKLDGIIDQLASQGTGEGVTSFYTEGDFPLAILALMGVEDATKTRASYGALLDLLFVKGVALAKAEMAKDGAQLPPAAQDIKDLPGLVKFVEPFAAPMGVALSLVGEDKDGTRVDALRLKLDWAKIKEMSGGDPMVETASKIVGNTLDLAFAYKGKLVGFGFGPKGVDNAVGVANGKRAGGEKTLTAAARGAAMAMTIRVDTAMKALTWIPELAPLKSKIDAIPAGRAFTLQGASDGKAVSFTLGVPLDVVAALAAFDR